MNTIILLAAPFQIELRRKIDSSLLGIGPCEVQLGADLTPSEAPKVRVLVTMGSLKTDAAMMDRLPNLGLICCYGSGYEGVDTGEARRRGITVTHSPAVNAAAVADLAMALLLAANRRIVMADAFVRNGCWSGHAATRSSVLPGLTGRKIGVFGYGAIGRKIAERAAAFEVHIAYHSRSKKPEAPYPFHQTLQSLADWADILIVAARADAYNRHAVNYDVIKALGPQGILINISRGSIVDEEALIKLLKTGELSTAGLDVYENEPLVPDALKAIPHVVLTPHIGGGTSDAHKAMENLVIANIVAFLSGKLVKTPVPI